MRFFHALVLPIAFHLAVLIGYLAVYRGDWSALICVDKDLIGKPPFQHVTTGFGTGGYDGLFYYVISHDPFHQQTSNMDVAAMRHIRIGYPVVCWLLSGGSLERLIYVMPLVNFLAIIGTFVLMVRLAKFYQRPAWWGAISAFSLNSGMSLLRDLTDPFATMMLVGLIVSWIYKDRFSVQFVWAIAAVLSREQNAAAVGILVLMELRRRQFTRAFGFVSVIVLLIGWVFYLKLLYGHWPFLSGNLSYPMQGFVWRIVHLWDRGSIKTVIIHIAGLSAIFGLIIGGIAALAIERRFVSSLLIFGGLVLTICGSDYIYASLWSYHRVFTFLPLGLGIWSIETGRRWPLWIILPGIAWPVLAVVQAMTSP